MTVTYDQVLAANGASDADQDIAMDVLEQASYYISDYTGSNLIDSTQPVPDSIYDEAVLACAVDLFARRKAPFGQKMVPDGAGGMVAVRLGMDPLSSARPKLRPWCQTIGFAFPLDVDPDADS